MRSMFFGFLERFYVVLRYGHPADAEIEAFVENYQARLADIRGVLVFSEGSLPTARQREMIREGTHSEPRRPIAVITSSAFTRNGVGLMRWFLKEKIKAFPPREFDQAIAFLGGDAADTEKLRTLVDSMMAELSGSADNHCQGARMQSTGGR